MSKRLLIYVFLYAVSVSLLTFALERATRSGRFFLMFLRIENAIYDQLQRYAVIDNRLDGRYYQKYREELDDIIFVNFDRQLIDLASGRIKRDKLATLLDSLVDVSSISTLFLDYYFVPYDATQTALSPEDSMLVRSMKRWGDRLILPYTVDFPSLAIDGKLKAEELEKTDELLLYRDAQLGFLAFTGLRGEETYRYHRLRTDDDQSHSVVYEMVKKEALNQLEKLPSQFEINYLLRDRQGDAIRKIDGGRIIAGRNMEDYTGDKRSHLAFAGLFDPLRDHYDRLIDNHDTPVQENLSGPYIILNAYLNAKTGSYFKRADWLLIGFINLLIASIGVWYFFYLKQFSIKPLFWIIAEVLGSILLFLGTIFCLFIFFQIKIPFIITSLVYLRNHSLLNAYLQKFGKL